MPRWPKRTPEERFWPKVDRRSDDECWPWLATKIDSGYGHFRVGARLILAHRFAYEALIGPIPDSVVSDHTCRNRACVNPRHIDLVSNAENVRRGLAGARNRAKTHCDHGHEFTPENTHVYPDGKRRCKACAQRWSREERIRRRSRAATPRESAASRALP